MVLLENVTHDQVVKFLHDVLSDYRKPKLTIGSSASKLEYDDIIKKKEFTISQKQIEELYSQIKRHKIEGAALYGSHYIEMPLRVGKWFFQNPTIIQDNANGLIYRIGNPSNFYTLFLFDYVINNISRLVRNEFHSPHPFLPDLSSLGESVFDLMSNSSEVVTIHIRSVPSRTRDRLVKLATAMAYEIAFNSQSYCSLAFTFKEYFSEPTLPALERKRENISFPRRSYSSTLVAHYSNALNSSNPVSKYLSFYHIIEHHFDEIAIEDARETFRKYITKTGFSINNNGHVDEILHRIRDKLIIDNDGSLRGSKESHSTLLTLKKLILLQDLIDKLSPEEREYYQNHKVPFADTFEIDFSSEDQFYPSLARRIYQTRNSIVHSKENNSNRFKADQDRGALNKEIPLIRSIAEIIIERTSDQADFRY